MPKPTHRQVTAPPGRFFRVHLNPRRVLMLKLLHNGLLDTIASGQGSEVALWELAAMALTWSRTADLLGEGGAQILPMLELATRMVTRWRHTGRVAFEGDEYETACVGTMVMDALASRTDAATATEASYWSEAQMLVLRTVAEAEAAAPEVVRLPASWAALTEARRSKHEHDTDFDAGDAGRQVAGGGRIPRQQ